MFKNDEEQLKEIVKGHAAGNVEIKTELERLMTTEALEMIRAHYDNKRGKQDLEVLLAKTQHSDKKNML